MNDPGYMRGTVPWNFDDALEMFAWIQTLVEMPKDDWDLAKRGFCMEAPDDGDLAVRLNMFHPMNQIGMYFMNKYEPPEGTYHLNRFMQIHRFVSEHSAQLAQEGWIRGSSDGDQEIAPSLLQALCMLEYTERDDEADIEHWVFAYDTVTEKAGDISQGEIE